MLYFQVNDSFESDSLESDSDDDDDNPTTRGKPRAFPAFPGNPVFPSLSEAGGDITEGIPTHNEAEGDFPTQNEAENDDITAGSSKQLLANHKLVFNHKMLLNNEDSDSNMSINSQSSSQQTANQASQRSRKRKASTPKKNISAIAHQLLNECRDKRFKLSDISEGQESDEQYLYNQSNCEDIVSQDREERDSTGNSSELSGDSPQEVGDTLGRNAEPVILQQNGCQSDTESDQQKSTSCQEQDALETDLNKEPDNSESQTDSQTNKEYNLLNGGEATTDNFFKEGSEEILDLNEDSATDSLDGPIINKDTSKNGPMNGENTSEKEEPSGGKEKSVGSPAVGEKVNNNEPHITASDIGV